ncbi:MAG TPA: hypothetical protein IAA42_06645 [Candidatus Olsenella excrementavium]|uniref:Uncharacterized protein n=1 Tax=Candidatus Olsenella excrementavium TaxID=2838709 RepID=A0A9D1ZC44_9ACTN|nr:hypothetical protein [Candidatus Olsenella excrementavium]
MYKVVCRKDAAVQGSAPRWEQGCPLQIQILQISRDTESSELFLQARIRNISDRDIAAYRLTAEITHDDNTKDTFVIEVLDADLPAGETQDLSPKSVGKGTVSDTELVALSVQQGDATWRSCAKPSGLPRRTLLELPDELRIIRRYALRKAGVNQVNKVLDGAVRDEDNFWICACGQANVNRKTCCSCSSSKEILRSLESADKLRELGEAQGRQEAKSRRVRFIAAASVVAVTMVGVAVPQVIIPQIKYLQAHSAVDNGDYDRGIALFRELGDYSDAAGQAKIAEWSKREQLIQDALEAIDGGDYEHGVEQLVDLEATGEANEAMYAYASSHLNYDDQLTFTYLHELSGIGYRDAADLYEQLYGWRVSLIVNMDENDWNTDLSEYTSRDPQTGLVGNPSAYAHIRVDNGPFADLSLIDTSLELALYTIREDGSLFELPSARRTLYLHAAESGSLNGATSSESISLAGTVRTGTQCVVAIEHEGEVIASKTLTNTNALNY